MSNIYVAILCPLNKLDEEMCNWPNKQINMLLIVPNMKFKNNVGINWFN